MQMIWAKNGLALASEPYLNYGLVKFLRFVAQGESGAFKVYAYYSFAETERVEIFDGTLVECKAHVEELYNTFLKTDKTVPPIPPAPPEPTP